VVRDITSTKRPHIRKLFEPLTSYADWHILVGATEGHLQAGDVSVWIPGAQTHRRSGSGPVLHQHFDTKILFDS